MHEKRIDIRWRDQDAYQHVNQGVYMTYLEEILDDWIREVLGLGEGEVWDYVAAHASIDWRSELRLFDRQVVGSASLVRVGTKSVTAGVEMRAAPDGRLAAEAEIVIVARDPATGASKALTDEERAAFEAAA